MNYGITCSDAANAKQKALATARKRREGKRMSSGLKQFKARALARPEVRREYDALADEFEIRDEMLKARAEAGVTQAELAERIGTTQSAVARMESPTGKHSPSIATLKRYASALGYRLQVRLVKEERKAYRAGRKGGKAGRTG